MKKYFTALLLAFALFANQKIFATALGPQLNLDYGFIVTPLPDGYTSFFGNFRFGSALSAKFDALPVFWAFSFDAAKHQYDSNNEKVSAWILTFAASADWQLINAEIKGLWHWFGGFGIVADVGFTTTRTNVYTGFGPRAFIGMDWFFMDGFLELYAQQVLQPMLHFAFGNDARENGAFRFAVRFPSEIGLRFYF